MKRGFAGIIAAVIVVLLVAVVLVSRPDGVFPPVPSPSANPSGVPIVTPVVTPSPVQGSTADLKSFNSWEDVKSFISSASAYSNSYGDYGEMGGIFKSDAVFPPSAMPLAQATSGSDSGASTTANDFSTTNVQVAGVDEPDIVKTDGTNFFVLSSNKIVILKAYPPSQASILAVINDSLYSDLFVYRGKLVAFGNEEFNWTRFYPIVEEQTGSQPPQPPSGEVAGSAPVAKSAIAVMPGIAQMPPYYRPYYSSSPFVKVFDISNPAEPKLLKKLDFNGRYVDSRLIGSKVYAIFNENAQANLPRPLYAVDGMLRSIEPSDIGYFDYPDSSFQFTTVVGVDLNALDLPESRKVVLMGAGNNVFVSQDNAYVTYTNYNYLRVDTIVQALTKLGANALVPFRVLEKFAAIDISDVAQWRKDGLKLNVLSSFVNELNDSERQALQSAVTEKLGEIYNNSPTLQSGENTVIHKFSLSGVIEYVGSGAVPGHVLNQFSMDEFEGNFRIATTISPSYYDWRVMPMVVGQDVQRTEQTNNLYVLDSGLKTIGKIEGLAPGEKIYSARFMGKRAYLVTFKKVDPLFVIGLEDPSNPKVLGKLKIPGYSDYLHPYDETHLIGLGKDAVPSETGDFAWYQGVKLSLFDVSDVETPKEVASFKIGDRGTDSFALSDHKAFLFSKERGLLVIPIRLAEINPTKYPQGVEATAYGDYTFQGAYVFNVSLSGFGLRGRVSHADPEELAKSGEYYYGGGTDVKRSAYINDVLYTFSDKFVKANDLSTLEQKAEVSLPYYSQDYPAFIE